MFPPPNLWKKCLLHFTPQYLGCFVSRLWQKTVFFGEANYRTSGSKGVGDTPSSTWSSLVSCEPGSKLLVLGMVIPPLIGNPYNEDINPYYWVDDHPLLYGNIGSWSTRSHMWCFKFDKYLAMMRLSCFMIYHLMNWLPQPTQPPGAPNIWSNSTRTTSNLSEWWRTDGFVQGEKCLRLTFLLQQIII